MEAEDLEPMEAVELIRSSVMPIDVAEMAELEVVRNKIHSPFNPEDHTPSCHLFDDHWWDYSTGQGGDVIDLYQVLAKASWKAAVHRLLQGIQSADFDAGRVQRVAAAPPTDLRAEFYRGDHLPLTDDWLLPGVPKWYMDQLMNADELAIQLHTTELDDGRSFTAPRMLIPHWVGTDFLPGIKVRYPSFKAGIDGSKYLQLYGPTSSGADTVIIMEGESDCWAMDAYKWEDTSVDVKALPAGAGKWDNRWLEDLAAYDRVITCFDNDHAGRKATDVVSHAVGFGRWEELAVPQLINDAREALARGWEPKL